MDLKGIKQTEEPGELNEKRSMCVCVCVCVRVCSAEG